MVVFSGNDTLLDKIKHKLYNVFCSILPTLMPYQPVLIMHVFATSNFGTTFKAIPHQPPRKDYDKPTII